MSIFEHHRFEIWNQTQHPYKHNITDFSYTNNALNGVSNLQGALDYIVAVLYPNNKAAVANVAALPSVGNTLNDYRVVQDDGDGKASGYRWEQREGDATPKWYKIYDVDFGAGTYLAQAFENYQDLFVQKFGNDDLDSSGVAVAGTFAGQTIYGGKTASKNLTLKANAGDGVGAGTGFVQVFDQFRIAGDGSTVGLTYNSSNQLFVGPNTTFQAINSRTGVVQITTNGTLNRAISLISENQTNGPILALSLNTGAGNGTFGYPNAGNSLAQLQFAGGDVANTRLSSGGTIIFSATTTWTASNRESNYKLQLVPNGSTTLTDVHAVASDGSHVCGISGSAAASHTFYGDRIRVGSGLSAAAPFISNNSVNDGSLTLTGSTGISAGGIIVLFGNTHATSANITQFQNNNTVTGSISAAGLWTLGPSGGSLTNVVNGDVSITHKLMTQRLDVASAATISAMSSANSFVRLTGSTATTLKSIAAGVDGQQLVLFNNSGANLTINHEDAGETAANRITTMTGANISTTANGAASFIYDTGTSRWICLFVTA